MKIKKVMSRYVFCADFFGVARKLRFIFIKIKPCSILIFETKFIFLVSNLYHNIKLSNKFDWFFFSSQFWLKIWRGQNFHRYMISSHFRAEKSIFFFLIFSSKFQIFCVEISNLVFPSTFCCEIMFTGLSWVD